MGYSVWHMRGFGFERRKEVCCKLCHNALGWPFLSPITYSGGTLGNSVIVRPFAPRG